MSEVKEVTTDNYNMNDPAPIRFAGFIIRHASKKRLLVRQVIQACALVLVDTAVSNKGNRDEVIAFIEEAWRRAELGQKEQAQA